MDGLWLENGPFRLGASSTPSITINEHSWHRAPSYSLYIDQPVGTGLSYSKSKEWATNDAEVNEYFYGYLTNFFSVHSYLLEGRETVDVYFSGESHAGHYIPSMMNYILDKNKSGGKYNINLKGAMIGNGWMDPYNQYAVSDFALAAGYIGVGERRYFDEMEVRTAGAAVKETEAEEALYF